MSFGSLLWLLLVSTAPEPEPSARQRRAWRWAAPIVTLNARNYFVSHILLLYTSLSSHLLKPVITFSAITQQIKHCKNCIEFEANGSNSYTKLLCISCEEKWIQRDITWETRVQWKYFSAPFDWLCEWPETWSIAANNSPMDLSLRPFGRFVPIGRT